jgi:hypothetical protein
MPTEETAYYAAHRSPEGKKKMQAWYRARQRALTAVANNYPDEFQRLVTATVKKNPENRRSARESALRKLSKKHPEDFRKLLDRHLRSEPDYQVRLRRGPKVRPR